jgi:hypothetical protein
MKAYLQSIVKTMDLGDPKTSKVSEIKETTTPNDVKLFGINCTGPAIGVEMFYSATAFSPKKGTYFAILDTETAAEAKAHEKVMSEILNSIKPISGANAE